MFDPGTSAHEAAENLIINSLKSAALKGNLPETDDFNFVTEIPKSAVNGDLSCNIAMTKAREFKLAPRVIADILIQEMNLTGGIFEKVGLAGPGFINFYYKKEYYADSLKGIIENGEDFGKSDSGCGKKIMVEFVSANPTGPMHLGNARGGALGDCLASAFEATGWDVTREFYVNDAGNQIEKFAVSLEARYLELLDKGGEFPEDGYQGQDIIERAREFIEAHGDAYITETSETRKKALVEFALPKNLEQMKTDLNGYRIDFDIWFRESTLYENNTVEKVLDILRKKDAVYEKDNALWYRATDFGADKDEVLIRQNGFPTYFAADIAYHYNKFIERGFDRVINIWGADHHGHVARLKGAMDAVGIGSDRLVIVINQMVNLLQGKEPIRMSKRTGKAITLSTLLEEIPVDAARFFFNLREPKSHLDFDIELAAKQDSDNPVYYVQYAHARICSILKGLEAGGVSVEDAKNYDFSVLIAAEERALIKHLTYLPGEIAVAAKEYDPAGITRYTIELATLFHRFYTNCRVKGEPDSIMYPRIALCIATRQVIRNCSKLLKIAAPESM